MSTEITELLYVSREPAWAPWAVQYFFLIGLSFGSFLLTLPGVAFGRATWWPLGRSAAPPCSARWSAASSRRWR